jgi:hypothetical protein
MDAALKQLRVWPAWQKLRRLVISAAHEDLATGARAEEFCNTLARYLQPKCEIVRELWPSTELRTPKLRAIAAGEAAAADLVIVSVHCGETLPGEIMEWIGLWQKQSSNRQRVLAALFDPLYHGSSSSIQAFLQDVARKGKMEFLARTDEKAEE